MLLPADMGWGGRKSRDGARTREEEKTKVGHEGERKDKWGKNFYSFDNGG